MTAIRLKYGKGELALDTGESVGNILLPMPSPPPLTDAEINLLLDQSVDHPTIEEFTQTGGSVLIVVPDATRMAGAGQLCNLLVRRLIASGIAPFDIRIIFATGIHRAVTDAERSEILTPFIAQRIKTLDHRPSDLMSLMRVGETAGGIPVELSRALFEHDHIFTIGSVAFHYFAGFTGGRKSIVPGLASTRTIAETHKLAFDTAELSRRKGVGTGSLKGNAVHEAFVEAANFVKPSFTINTIVDEDGGITALTCGDRITSHEKACGMYAESHTVKIAKKRPLVIAGCGGSPFDINLIQAHKTLDAAAAACEEGGRIILLAECSEGLGRADMAKWFDAKNSRELAEMLAEKYQVNGQTAWSIMEKAERFNVSVVTSLDEATLRSMKMTPLSAEEFKDIKAGDDAYIIPAGHSIRVEVIS